MQSSAKEISAAIVAAGGAVSFEKFMELALYSPNGFYSTDGRAGRRGDFITSPEVGPLFGSVVGNAIDAQWKALGSPKEFTLVEVGAGPGTLARSTLTSDLACRDALSYIAVERSTSQLAMHPNGVTSLATMPSEPFVGVILANELLDNLPFRLFVFDGQWQEAFVVEQDATFLEVLRKVEDAPAWLPHDVRHGSRIAVQSQAQNWLANSLSLVKHGAIIVFDYCTTSTEAVHKPWREWLRTYRQHEVGEHYLRHPGSQDITCHVMVDQLDFVCQPTRVSSQADWLNRFGIGELVEQGKAYWQANAARPDLEAMKMRSRISEAEALRAPNGLGNFKVLEWHQF